MKPLLTIFKLWYLQLEKKLEYENLREWFKGLYETVLGQSEGPRMGSFIKLYGIEPTKKLLENVILGNLVKE